MFSRLICSCFATLILFGTLPSTAFAKSIQGTQRYERTYTEDYLKNHPLQFIKRTQLILTPQKEGYSAKWTATLRDIRTDEEVRSEAKGTCTPVRAKRKGPTSLTCSFGTEMSEVRITPRRGGVLLSIPHGNGVRFNQKQDGQTVWAEMLLGEDSDNNTFLLFR